MRTYSFKAANASLFVFTIFISLVVGSLLIALAVKVGLLPKGNTISELLLFGLLIALTIYITRLTSLAKVEVTLDEEYLSIKWLEHFLFYNKEDLTIPFKNITAYVDQSDSNWDWIKLEISDRTIYRIWHSNFFSKDDYSRFVSDFISLVKHHNETIQNKYSSKPQIENIRTIQRSKSIYETTGGAILAGIAILLLIGLPIVLFTIPPKSPSNYFAFGPGYAGAIYFTTQFYLKRRRKINAE